MTQRQRYLEFIKGKPCDLPLWGDWVGPYSEWLKHGLPPAPEVYRNAAGILDDRAYQRDYFGYEGIYSCFWGTGRLPVNVGLCPGFPYEVIEETPEYRIIRDGDGVLCKMLTIPGHAEGAAQYLGNSLHGAVDWESFKRDHLDPNHPAHYPPDAEWNRLVEACKDRDFVVTIDGGSFYGYLRNWLSVEGISYLMHDEPEWMEEAANYLADYFIAILTRAVTDIPDIDCALFWEDMCFKNGPLCSPAMFKRFFLKPYQKVTTFLRDHGVKSFWVDCDGNIEQLIELFIEGGVNGFYPLEVAAGMDAMALKQQYGDRILLWGGVDKRALLDGKEAIDAELARVLPAVQYGGFIPLIDHGVLGNTRLEDFVYYDKRRKELLGLKAIPLKGERIL